MDDHSIYELSPDVTAPAKSSASRNVRAVAPIALAYRRAKPAASGEPASTDAIKNLYMPLWLLGGGIAVDFVAAALFSESARWAALWLTCQLFIMTAVMLAGIWIAAHLRGIDLGDRWAAVLKLSSISVAPTAAGVLVWPALRFIPFGGLLGLGIEFVLYFALLGALFDLDESDTWVCVWTIFLVRVVVSLALAHFWG
jgi:hypothetical protein